jgi:PmbA protein
MTSSKAIENINLDRLADFYQLTQDVLHLAIQQGATQAEVAVSMDTGLSTTVRSGEVETLEFHREQGVGITVFFGKRKGIASSSDINMAAIEETVKAACNIAQFTMPDECAGLADPELMAYEYPDLDLYHPWAISPEEAIAIATECETAGRKIDKRITNSEGASLNTHEGIHVYGNTHGFIGGYPTSRYTLSCVLIGEHQGNMQRDYWYTISRDGRKLESAKLVAQRAAERTLARLGARKIKTGKYPILFQADAARGLLGSFISAIQGNSLYRNASFLVDTLGKQVFAPWVNIEEHPLLPGALASAPFDAEGVRTKPKSVVIDGVLQSYILSSYSARKLNMTTTGNAGGVHNLFIKPDGKSGNQDLSALLKQMGTGILVTELMGQGTNIITGDYSRGAVGFWVENGVIQYPIEEFTIASNLKEMFLNLVAVGNDIDTRSGIHTGSWLLDTMTVAGE